MKWDKIISGTIATCGGIANYLWGGWDMALKTLLLFMVLDYLSGWICAIKDKRLSSEVGFRGILKKVTILVVIAVAVAVDDMAGTNGLVRSLVIFFYASMEGLSILENAARMDVGIPEQLTDLLLQLKEGNKKEIIHREEN